MYKNISLDNIRKKKKNKEKRKEKKYFGDVCWLILVASYGSQQNSIAHAG